jgi:lactoylglutathione lyase
MAPPTNFDGIRAVSIPVTDQDKALTFYVGTLGFTKVRDMPTPNGDRFIELIPGSRAISVTLELAPDATARGPVGIRFETPDAEAAHAMLQEAGVDVHDILRWPGVPPVFAFRDPDRNTFSLTEPGR